MSDKVIKCHSCGFPLEASSVTQNRIKCPKCGVVNVIETAKSPDSEKEGIAGGFPLTAGGAAIHKSIVTWILQNHETMPHDIFQDLKITGVERLCAPCYLFECSATVRFSYQIGNKRERTRKMDNGFSDSVELLSNLGNFKPVGGNKYIETYTEYTHQNDVYDYSDNFLVAGASEYAEKIQYFSSQVDFSDLVEIDRLSYPSDVKQIPFNVPASQALPEIKALVKSRVQENIKQLLESCDYKDLNIREDYRLDYGKAPKRILVPLIHVTFAYKDKTGDVWLSSNAKKALIEKFPCSQEFKDSLKKSQDQKPTIFQWITALFLIQTIFYTRRGITMFKELSNASKSATKQLEKLQKEHNAIFTRFLQNQIPLKGVLQKGLQGKPEAFPDKQLLSELDLDSH